MMLAKKVRAVISNMRVMRSKAFGRFMKRSRISHKMRRHMRKEAKQANESNEANEMGGTFFDWDELGKAEGNEAAMMGGGDVLGQMLACECIDEVLLNGPPLMRK